VTRWDDDALITIYRRGLKSAVKDELMRTRAKIETLEELIRETIDIDDKLYERKIEDRYDRNNVLVGIGSDRQHKG
jgi:hypothetical protein